MAEKKALLLRIPHSLWEELNRWAKDDLRSLNGQVEYILREAVRKRTGRTVEQDQPIESPPPDRES